jgi:hypothetical protein
MHATQIRKAARTSIAGALLALTLGIGSLIGTGGAVSAQGPALRAEHGYSVARPLRAGIGPAIEHAVRTHPARIGLLP